MFLANPDRDIALGDGRRLCYTSYGQPDGSPVLVFEPVGLQLLSQFGQWPASRAGARLITPYRPGFGHSDPNPGATLSDWADDLRQLLDRLELGSVAVVAIFSSSVAALTAAHELPDRITSIGLLNPAGPPDPRRSTRPTLSMLVRRHRLARVLGWGSTGRLVDQVIRSLAPSDRNVLLEAHRRGLTGCSHRDQPVHTRRDLRLDESLERWVVDCPIRLHRRHQGRHGARHQTL